MCFRFILEVRIEELRVANKLNDYRLQSLTILQFCNQTKAQINLKNCVFVSNEAFYLTLTLFLRLLNYQFVKH